MAEKRKVMRLLKIAQSFGKKDSFVTALQVSLFDIDALGMFYKTCILDFLATHNHHKLIKEYRSCLIPFGVQEQYPYLGE